MIIINVNNLIKGSEEEILTSLQVKKLPKEVNLTKPLGVSAKIYKIPHGVTVEAGIKGEESVKCDRCGSEYESEIDDNFSQEYILAGKSQGDEEYEERAGFVINDKNEIDIEEAIIEEIAVKDSSKNLCKKECKGICEHCGKDLNKGNCSCYTKFKSNNPFDKLKDFKEKM